jgi:hypothetical protein
MSTSDLLSLSSLIVATLAFVIALLSLIYTTFMRPRMKMLLGGYMWLFYSYNKKLILQLDLAFFNSGAQPGALVEFSGALTLPDGSRKPLHSIGFGEGKGGAENLPQTIIVSGRGAGGAETKSIFFITNDPLELQHPGKHFLDLQALIGPRLTQWCTVSAILDMVQEPGIKDDLSFLDHYTREKENQQAAFALQMQRETLSRRSWAMGFFRQPIPTFRSVNQLPLPTPEASMAGKQE